MRIARQTGVPIAVCLRSRGIILERVILPVTAIVAIVNASHPVRIFSQETKLLNDQHANSEFAPGPIVGIFTARLKNKDRKITVNLLYQ